MRGISERDQRLPGSGHQSFHLSENAEILPIEIDGYQGLSVCPGVSLPGVSRAGVSREYILQV